MNHPTHEHGPIEQERMRRARAVWQGATPSPFAIAAAEKRIAARNRGRVARSIRALIVPAIAAVALLLVTLPRHRAVPIAPVAEEAPAKVILAPAASPDPAASDTLRLDAAEAQHRAGQCRAAKPVLEELAAKGATPQVRARARALLDEIARLQATP